MLVDPVTVPRIAPTPKAGGSIVRAYCHSDAVTPGKAGALVRLETESEAASYTPEVIAFADEVVRLVVAARPPTGAYAWAFTVETFPEIGEKRAALEKVLKERVVVSDVVYLGR